MHLHEHFYCYFDYHPNGLVSQLQSVWERRYYYFTPDQARIPHFSVLLIYSQKDSFVLFHLNSSLAGKTAPLVLRTCSSPNGIKFPPTPVQGPVVYTLFEFEATIFGSVLYLPHTLDTVLRIDETPPYAPTCLLDNLHLHPFKYKQNVL